MAAKKVGDLIKEARTEAGLTQEQLAKKISGVSASDISKVERKEKDLTNDQLKQAAKALGVTQKSLLEAPKNVKASSSSSAKKTTSSTAKKTSSASTAKKTTSGTTMKVTASEKKLVELYREADSETKKAAVAVLKGETTDAGDILSSILSGVIGKVGK